MSRSAAPEAPRAGAQTTERGESTADAAPADAKAVIIQASGEGAAADGEEDAADEFEVAAVLDATGETNAAQPAPQPPAVPVAVAPVLAPQQGETIDGGDGITAATDVTAPPIPIAGPQGPQPPKGGTDEAATTDTGLAGAEPSQAEGSITAGKGAVAADSGEDGTPPPPLPASQPVSRPTAEVASAVTAGVGKPPARAESQSAKADEPVAEDGVAAAAGPTPESPESATVDHPRAAPAQHRSHNHADLQKADDGAGQPPGNPLSESAPGAKPPSETLPAFLQASKPLDGATVQSLQAAPAATQAASQEAVPIAGLAVEIAARAQAGRNRFEIRLDPPELGRIDVRLDVDRSGQVTSRLVVERAETLEYLRRDAAELERALQQAGLKTADNGLQFTLRDQGFARRDEHAPPYAARLIVADSGTASTDVQQGGYGPAWRTGGIDIRV